MEKLFIPIGKRYYVNPNSKFAEVIGIYPAGQVSGRNEHQYSVMLNGVSFMLTRKQIDQLFLDEPISDEPCKQCETLKGDIEALEAKVKLLESSKKEGKKSAKSEQN